MTLHVLLEVCRRLELLVAGLASVDLDARQLLPVLLQVQRQLALENELIPALHADQILQGGWVGDRGRTGDNTKRSVSP